MLKIFMEFSGWIMFAVFYVWFQFGCWLGNLHHHWGKGVLPFVLRKAQLQREDVGESKKQMAVCNRCSKQSRDALPQEIQELPVVL